jgi:hypothetical protein
MRWSNNKFNMDLNIDTTNPVIQLCMAGARAEFEHRIDDAHVLYQQAWDARTDDYEACIAAHYVARFQETPEETLQWNQIALDHADASTDERVKEFYPSLYLNLGLAHELLGNQIEAQRYYNLAADLGFIHQRD